MKGEMRIRRDYRGGREKSKAYRRFYAQIKARADFRDQSNVPDDAGEIGGSGRRGEGGGVRIRDQDQVLHLQAQQICNQLVILEELHTVRSLCDANEERPQRWCDGLQVGHCTGEQVVLEGQVARVKVVDAQQHCPLRPVHLLDLGQGASRQANLITLRGRVPGRVQKDFLDNFHVAPVQAHHEGLSLQLLQLASHGLGSCGRRGRDVGDCSGR